MTADQTKAGSAVDVVLSDHGAHALHAQFSFAGGHGNGGVDGLGQLVD
jgi:hypothetical protein